MLNMQNAGALAGQHQPSIQSLWCVVHRSFYADRQAVPVDKVLQLPKVFAREMGAAGKVALYETEEQAHDGLAAKKAHEESLEQATVDAEVAAEIKAAEAETRKAERRKVAEVKAGKRRGGPAS